MIRKIAIFNSKIFPIIASLLYSLINISNSNAQSQDELSQQNNSAKAPYSLISNLAPSASDIDDSALESNEDEIEELVSADENPKSYDQNIWKNLSNSGVNFAVSDVSSIVNYVHTDPQQLGISTKNYGVKVGYSISF